MKVGPKKYSQLLFEITKDKSPDDIKVEIEKFTKLLIKKNQIKNQNKIIENFISIYNSENNIVNVEVETANPITKEVLSHIETFIAKKTGAKKIEFENKINKSLISGAIIKYGDRILDNSFKTKINNLKNNISK
ncbi:MAG: ATP synthase F1 subunit delta [Patescibacteria group bacterium]|nr:ATP synthase F1 subunit delta [Patescibacteria group bacterium]MDD4304072.1 ATP synthase F1 subunit delta [Patescibacteria group bacterium]MDD4694949.1 ATP synthase F1 subunit delta [Patescibacteria group bacterium]